MIAVGSPGDKQVFGTKDGEVYRHTGSGWEQVTPPSGGGKATAYSGGNRPATPSQLPDMSNRPTAPTQLPGGGATRPAPGNVQDLERQRQAQDRGNLRANSYQNTRPAGGYRGGGGGGHAGGGRRR